VWPAACVDMPNMAVVGEWAAGGPVASANEVDVHAQSGLVPMSIADHQADAARRALDAGDAEAAATHLAASEAAGGTALSALVAADLAGRRGDWTASLAAADRAAARAPGDWRASLMRAAALAELRRDAEALAAALTASDLGGHRHPSVAWLRFVAQYRLGDAAAAEAALADLHRLAPDHPRLDEAVAAFSTWQGRAPQFGRAGQAD